MESQFWKEGAKCRISSEQNVKRKIKMHTIKNPQKTSNLVGLMDACAIVDEITFSDKKRFKLIAQI